MITTSTTPEQRVLLKNISWKLFERLLQEMGEQRSTRLAYYKGKLELMGRARWKCGTARLKHCVVNQ